MLQDGSDYLCVVDESNEHTISVWEWKAGRKVTETKSSSDPVLAVEFNPLEPNSIVTCGKNHLAFWSLDGCQLSKKMGIYEVLILSIVSFLSMLRFRIVPESQ